MKKRLGGRRDIIWEGEAHHDGMCAVLMTTPSWGAEVGFQEVTGRYFSKPIKPISPNFNDLFFREFFNRF